VRAQPLYDGGWSGVALDSADTVPKSPNTFGANGLLSRNAGGTSTFYTFDPQVSVAQRFGNRGALLSTDQYDAFGALKGQTPSGVGDVFGYGAQWGYLTDNETGLLLLTNQAPGGSCDIPASLPPGSDPPGLVRARASLLITFVARSLLIHSLRFTVLRCDPAGRFPLARLDTMREEKRTLAWNRTRRGCHSSQVRKLGVDRCEPKKETGEALSHSAPAYATLEEAMSALRQRPWAKDEQIRAN